MPLTRDISSSFKNTDHCVDEYVTADFTGVRITVLFQDFPVILNCQGICKNDREAYLLTMDF